MNTIKLLRRKAASQYLYEAHGLERAPSTLAKLAVTGGGPMFQHIGRVPYYSPEHLDTWVASKLSRPVQSTSEAAAAGPPREAARTTEIACAENDAREQERII